MRKKIVKIAGIASIGLLMVPGMVFGQTINRNSLKYDNSTDTETIDGTKLIRKQVRKYRINKKHLRKMTRKALIITTTK